MLRENLISPYHLKQNQSLHNAKRSFGGSSFKWADSVKDLLYSLPIRTILDYGCGEATLEKAVFDDWYHLQSGRQTKHSILWHNYDPAIKKYSKIGKEKYDLIVCTDVLEHIEPGKLDNVLRHIFSLADQAVFFVIALNKANKSYPDGKNTHLILAPPAWWISRIKTKTSWRVTEMSTPRPDKDLVLEVCP